MKNLKDREDIIEFALKLNTTNLSPLRSGNLSIRVTENDVEGFLLTPSGIKYETLKPEDIVFLALNEKYDNPDGVHHYEISQSSGDTTTKIEVYSNEELYSGDTDFYSSATIVTNREFEENEQDKKRQIKLLDPAYVDAFVEEFDLLINESPI